MPQDPYNIALDCIDKHARSLVNKHKTALLYIKEESPQKLREPPLRLSFASLQGLTNAAANMFRDLGVQKGERVVLRLPNAPEFPINFLGAIKAGAIPIPTSPLITPTELAFILQDSSASVLMTTEELFSDAVGARHAVPLLWENLPDLKFVLVLTSDKEISAPQTNTPIQFHRWQDLIKKASAQFATEPTAADDPAFWLYTSGTTAQPKAVIHAHRSIRAHDARARVWQDMKAGDVLFNTSSLNWSYALTCGMLDVWRHGLTSLVFQGEPSAEHLCRIVRRHGVTTFMSVPGIYRRLISFWGGMETADFSSVRVCLSAGESLPAEIREEFKKTTGHPIHEGLGMTEHSVYLVQPFGETPAQGSCGKPLPEQKIAVLREDLSECDPEESGLLATQRSCPGLMLDYHQRPEETAAAYRGDWFLSGDLARKDAEGNVYFLGRNDDLIKAGGYRISPLEVEAALNSHPQVAESAVVSTEPAPGKTLAQAYVVLKEGANARQETAQEILLHAGRQLAPYKLPRQIVFLRELPKTANGKLQRNLLRTGSC